MSDARNKLIAYAMLGAGTHQCQCGHLRMEHDARGCESGWLDVKRPCDCPAFVEAVG